MYRLTTTFLAFVLLLGATTATAEEVQGLTVYPHVGINSYSNSSDLDSDRLYGIGIGYQFDSPWALEAILQRADSDSKIFGVGNVDVDSWRVDGLYHLNTTGNFRPFLSAGVGKVDYDFSGPGDDDESQYNVGAGFKWGFTDNTSLRGDVKFFNGTDFDAINSGLTLGIHHVFGKKKAPKIEAPADSDQDGVPDTLDKCPGTPAGVEVDSVGCPLDDDGDGVPNYKDECPGTTNRMAEIDDRGCYKKLIEKVSINLNVEFDFNSAKSRPAHADEVKKVAEFMMAYPGATVVVEGHTDSQGDESYNQNLSERRAKTISEMLIGQFGIAAGRVSSKGFGESKPISTNDTKEGRQRNRRVVAVVEGEKEVIQTK